MLHKKYLISTTLLLAAVFLFTGCATQYRVTHELEEYVNLDKGVFIEPIVDGLPADIDPDSRPSPEDLQKLVNYIGAKLYNELRAPIGTNNSSYTISGTILDYKKGSGLLRFLFGFLGNAKVTVELKLTETATGETIFAANFKQTVTNWEESGDKMFERVASDFAKAIKKRLKNLREQEES